MQKHTLAVLSDSDLESKVISLLPPMAQLSFGTSFIHVFLLFGFLLNIFPCNSYQVLEGPKKFAQEFRITLFHALTCPQRVFKVI